MTGDSGSLQNSIGNLPEGTPISHELLEWVNSNRIDHERYRVSNSEMIERLIGAVVGLELRLARLESSD